MMFDEDKIERQVNRLKKQLEDRNKELFEEQKKKAKRYQNTYAHQNFLAISNIEFHKGPLRRFIIKAIVNLEACRLSPRSFYITKEQAESAGLL